MNSDTKEHDGHATPHGLSSAESAKLKRLVINAPVGYAQEQRLRFIDSMLNFYGHIGRRELIDYFGIGPACATRDFKLYKEIDPNNVIYNVETKRYVRSESFDRVYL
jgi:hypothetical protein